MTDKTIEELKKLEEDARARWLLAEAREDAAYGDWRTARRVYTTAYLEARDA